MRLVQAHTISRAIWRNTTNDATHIGATHTTNDWFDGNNWGNQSNGNGIPVAPPDMSYWAAMDQNRSVRLIPRLSNTLPYC